MSASPAPSGDRMASTSASPWKEYKNAEGRSYWFHTEDKHSVWEKPDELKTPRERAIAATRWKEYKSGERSYYVHSDTKETTWSVPKELQDAFDRLEGKTASPAPGPPPGPPPVAPASKLNAVAGGPPRPIYSGPPPGFGSSTPGSAPGPPPGPPPIAPGQAPVRPPPAQTPARPPASAPTGPAAGTSAGPPIPLGPNLDAPFNPYDAFKGLLRDKGVGLDWTWEQTMRAVVTEPLYKVLKSISERKAAFADFQAELRRQRDEAVAEKKAQVKPTLVTLLSGSEKLKAYSSWGSVMKHHSQSKEVKAAIEAVGEEASKTIWEEVRREKQKAAEASTVELRHRNMDLLMSLLRTFEADVTTRWRDAQRSVVESSEWKQDSQLASMDMSDMLAVFDEYIRSIEREEGERRNSEDKERIRTERRNRAAFRALMAQGVDEGWVKAGSSWPEVYHRVKDDARYTNMLGQRGSSPLDLFFDAVDSCEQKVELRTATVVDLIKIGEPSWKGVPEDAEWPSFLTQVQSGLAASDKSEHWVTAAREDVELRSVFDHLREEAARNKRRHERKVRTLIDDAKYGLKKDLDDELFAQAEEQIAYDEVKERVEALRIKEWRAIDVELGRDGCSEQERDEIKRKTWDKFCRRQKEKAEERAAAAAAAASNSRKRKSDAASGLLTGEDEKRSRRREDRDSRRRGSAGAERGAGEDRDRRRAGRDEEMTDLPASSSSGKDGSPGYGSKKKRSEGAASPQPQASRRAVVSQNAADDGDKEEGEV
ncbi:hypothetical protein BDZ90DRAFT_250941 [Jaminaea rosea]|uniref:WW domain-containing protein n=1 Tax=Jaminaea rosea TaxID=1569628 RepID=A0A316UT08_9BASI|nr:hypothetical protein BDZ90DRAFT_250941 [Jaminaea rosea]PWN28436.1 hypothetical protein BDZ90DRAFT_250941 [Jaminaea rosea]